MIFNREWGWRESLQDVLTDVVWIIEGPTRFRALRYLWGSLGVLVTGRTPAALRGLRVLLEDPDIKYYDEDI